MRAWALILPMLLSLAPLGAAAQQPVAQGQVQSSVLTIDLDRLLAETQFGQRLAEDLQERTEALRIENERLTAELTEEERGLTERRSSMEMDTFRAEADAFDQRVQGIRADQDAKAQSLEAAVEQSRRNFLNAVTPTLGRLMIDSGAAVIMERRDVFLSAGLVDITDEAIAAIDAQLGNGLSLPETPAEQILPPETGDTAPVTATEEPSAVEDAPMPRAMPNDPSDPD